MKLKLQDLVKRIFEIDKQAKIIAIEANKTGKELLVTYQLWDKNLWVKLYGEDYQGITSCPRIMSTIRRKSDFEEVDTHDSFYVRIDDILMIDDDLGNGSIAMKHFFNIVESLKRDCLMNIEYIQGKLSSVDKGNFDRLEHFYKKHGFDVVFNTDRTSGSIKKLV
jgi:hypothetical protein